MLRFAAAIILLLLGPFPALADLWRCPQENGGVVFTDKVTDSGACQKYEGNSGVSVVTGAAAPASPPEAAPSKPIFTQPELDQMLAPIALYPDPLLSQILMAATYPLEVIEAARWSKANPALKGDQAVQAVAQNPWDPSVKSLVAFPEVLAMMDEHLPWMERLGDAFLSQQAQVMDTVQNLRRKAYDAGNLKSSDQVHVEQQGPAIMVEPPAPEMVYVPYYDPMLVYGSWWWPAYPPVYWAPWPGYFVRPGAGVVFAWGVGVPVGERFFFGAFDWPHRQVNVINVTNFYYTNNAVTAWRHDPIHRRGVFYRDASLRGQFRRTSASPEARREFRGHEPASFEGRGGFDRRPDVRSETPVAPGRGDPSHVDGRPHAFEGVGHGAEVRGFSERGHASAQAAAPRSSGGFHGGGGHR